LFFLGHNIIFRPLDVISVTTTKVEKGTKDVSQSISVVSKEEIESKDIINIKDALDNVLRVLAVSILEQWKIFSF